MEQTLYIARAPLADLEAAAASIDPIAEERAWPASIFETVQDGGDWTYSLYVPSDDTAEAEALFAEHTALTFARETIEDIDWVSATLADLAPVRAGRFCVHGSHDRAVGNAAPVGVEIDAGQAFGTGHHGTTAGCLDMLERVLRLESGTGLPAAVLDIGSGSGVLAIAFAKATRRPVLASDIDPIGERVARENAAINGVARHVSCITATGFGHPAFASFGKVDLVFANILARPLQGLARDLARHTAPGGWVILSGLLPHQGARIIAAYRQHGLVFRHRHIRDGWLTLLLRRP